MMDIYFVLSIFGNEHKLVAATKSFSEASLKLVDVAKQWCFAYGGSVNYVDTLDMKVLPSTAKIGYYIMYDNADKTSIAAYHLITPAGYFSSPVITRKGTYQIIKSSESEVPVVLVQDYKFVSEQYSSSIKDQQKTINTLSILNDELQKEFDSTDRELARTTELNHMLIAEEKELLALRDEYEKTINEQSCKINEQTRLIVRLEEEEKELLERIGSLEINYEGLKSINNTLRNRVEELLYMPAPLPPLSKHVPIPSAFSLPVTSTLSATLPANIPPPLPAALPREDSWGKMLAELKNFDTSSFNIVQKPKGYSKIPIPPPPPPRPLQPIKKNPFIEDTISCHTRNSFYSRPDEKYSCAENEDEYDEMPTLEPVYPEKIVKFCDIDSLLDELDSKLGN